MDQFPSFFQDEPLDEGQDMDPWLDEELFGAPDTSPRSIGSQISYSYSRGVDTEASISLPVVYPPVTPIDFNLPGEGGFLGEAPDFVGPPSHCATYPTPAVPHPSFHAIAPGWLQSNPRRAIVPSSYFPSADASHRERPLHPPLPIFSSQNRMDDMPRNINPEFIVRDGPPPIEDADMSRGLTVLSGPSNPSIYGPFGTPAVSNSPQIPSVMSIPAPPKKMNSARKHAIPRKTTSQAHIERGSTVQLRDGHFPKTRAHAQLKLGSDISFGDGCRLDNVAALPADYDSIAFEGQTFTQKASLRFEISPHRRFTCQFNVLHRGGRQPTKRRLAEVAARAVDHFIVDCAKSGRPCKCKLEHFVLRSIVVDSRSGLRPVFDLTIPATI